MSTARGYIEGYQPKVMVTERLTIHITKKQAEQILNQYWDYGDEEMDEETRPIAEAILAKWPDLEK